MRHVERRPEGFFRTGIDDGRPSRLAFDSRFERIAPESLTPARRSLFTATGWEAHRENIFELLARGVGPTIHA
jgi:hypothetical protein